MVGSNSFGRGLGEKKLTLIFDEYPDILKNNESSKLLKKKIIKIDGFSQKLTDLFVDNLPNFKEFLNLLVNNCKLNLNFSKINNSSIQNENSKLILTIKK